MDKRISVIIWGLIIFFIVFSMAPTLYEWNARGRIHEDRFFELVHNFPTDYNLYLSRIREGKEGSWLATEKYTSEPHAGSLSQIMYVLIGRLADYSHVQTPYVWFAYHVARVFFGGLLLWVIWLVSRWVFPKSYKWGTVAFLLIVTASTWPKFETVAGVPRLGGWMGWYTMSDSLQRITFMPHVTFAQAMLVFIMWVLAGGFILQQGSGRVHPGNYIFLGIIGLVFGIIFPPGLLFIYGVIGLVIIFELLFISRKNIKKSIQNWFFSSGFERIVFGVVSLPSLVYFMLLLQQYPWKRLTEFDVLHPTKFSFVEYFMAMGPTLPLGILGILLLVALKKWDVLSRFRIFIAWIVAWLVFIIVFNYIPQQSPTRFTQMVTNVPLGIFTAMLFYELIQLTDKFFLNKKVRTENPDLRFTIYDLRKKSIQTTIHYSLFIIPFIVVLFGLGTMSSSYMWLQDFIDHKLRATIPLVPSGAEVMYPMKDIVEGLTWLQVYTPRSSVVLTGMTTGNYTPVYAGNTAFVGHANTVKLEEKLAAVDNFYKKHLTLSEEMAWLREVNISYIFYGPEESDLSGGVEDLKTLYPDLTEVYKNAMVRIYKVP
jgi:hypothetical protein